MLTGSAYIVVPPFNTSPPTDGDESIQIDLAAFPDGYTSFTITYAWSLLKDSVQIDSGTSNTFSFTPDDNATYDVILAITGVEDVEYDEDNCSITINNVAPSADATGPYTVAEGSTVALSGTGSDVAADTLTFDWDLDGDGTYGEAGGSALQGDETGDSPILDTAGLSGTSDYTVSLRVRDEDGGTTVSTAFVQILNVAPEASAGGPYTVAEGADINLEGSGTDVGLPDELTFEWDLDGDGNFDLNGATPNFNATGVDGPELRTITLRVTDDDGDSSVATSLLQLLNTAPMIEPLDAYTVAEGSTVGLSAEASDPGIDDLTYLWDLDGDNQYGESDPLGLYGDENGPTPIFNATNLDGPLTLTVGLIVIDSDGDSSATTTTVDVTNVAPTGETTGPYTVEEGGTVGLSGTGSDVAPADTLTFDWDLDGDDVFGELGSEAENGDEQGLEVTFNAAAVDGPTTVTVTLRTLDDDGGSTTTTTTVLVTNVAPESFAGGPYTVDEGSSVQLAGTGSDIAPDDTLTFEWDFDGDSVFGESGSEADQGDEVGADASFNSHGLSGPSTVTVALRVTDDDGGSSTSTAEIMINNVAPNVVIDSLSEDAVDEAETVTLNLTVTDPGTPDSLTLTIDWGDGSAPEVIPHGTNRGEVGIPHSYPDDKPTSSVSDNYTITVTVSDDEDEEAEATTLITVNNVAPTVSFDISSAEVNENNEISISGTFEDVGLEDTHRVFVDWGDGSPEEEITITTLGEFNDITHLYLDDTIPFVDGTPQDDLTIRVRVVDDDTNEGTSTEIITVKDVEPTITSLTIETAGEGDVAYIEGTFSDPGTLDTFTAYARLEGGAEIELAVEGNTFWGYYSGFPCYDGWTTFELIVKVQDDDSLFDEASDTVEVSCHPGELLMGVNLTIRSQNECGCGSSSVSVDSSRGVAKASVAVGKVPGGDLASTTNNAPTNPAATTTNSNSEARITNSGDRNPHPIVAQMIYPEDEEEELPTFFRAKVEVYIPGEPGIVAQTPMVWHSRDPESDPEGDSFLLAMQFDATELETGRYLYQFVIEWDFDDPESPIKQRQIRRGGLVDVINETESPIGNRWRLNVVDELIVYTRVGYAGALFVGGDGGTYWFDSPEENTYSLPDNATEYMELTRRFEGETPIGYRLSFLDASYKDFDNLGRLIRRSDTAGNLWIYAYSGSTRMLTSITDFAGRATTFTYSSGKLIEVMDYAGSVSELTYDGDLLVSVERQDPDTASTAGGGTTTMTYDPVSKLLTTLTSTGGRVQTFAYDAYLRLASITENSTTQFELDPIETDNAVEFELPEEAPGTSPENPRLILFLDGSPYERRGEQRTSFGLEYTIKADRWGNLIESTDEDGTTFWYRNDRGMITQYQSPDPDGEGPLGPTVIDFDYDELLRLETITYHYTDTSGPTTATESWEYLDDTSFVESYTNESGHVALYDYNGSFELTTVTQYVDGIDDVVTTFTYTDAVSNEFGGIFLAGGLLATMTDANGRITRFDYYDDPVRAGWLFEILFNEAAVDSTPSRRLQYDYDNAGNAILLREEVEADVWRETEYAYDYLDRLREVTGDDPDGAGPLDAPVGSYEYDDDDNLIAIEDPNHNVANFAYVAGLLDETILPKAYSTDDEGDRPNLTYTYTVDRLIETVTDPRSGVTTYAYDSKRRLVSIKEPDPDGAFSPLARPETTYQYDLIDRLIRVVDPMGHAVRYTYNERDWITKIERQEFVSGDPLDDGSWTTLEATDLEYYANGQIKEITEPLDRVTNFYYDELGRLAEVVGPAPDSGSPSLNRPVTSYEYDGVGNLIKLTEPDPDALTDRPVTEYVYDHFNRLHQVIEPDPDPGNLTTDDQPITTYLYTYTGELTSVEDPMARVTEYGYDGLGRLTSILSPLPDPLADESERPLTTYTYDDAGNVLTVTRRINDTDDSVTTYEYDGRHQLVTEIDALGKETLFTYDKSGNLLSLEDPNHNVTSFVYDGLNRMIEETNELNKTRFYGYNAIGQLTSLLDRNGREQTFSYDSLDRLDEENWYDEISSLVRTSDYTYDGAGRLESVSDPSMSYAYAYDGLDRVLSVTSTSAFSTSVVLSSGYDGLGRRTSLAANVDTVDDFVNSYVYDDLSRLTSLLQFGEVSGNAVAEKRVAFTYHTDSQFNTITRYADLAADDALAAVSTYQYDDIGRLKGLTHAAGNTTFAGFSWAHDSANWVRSFANSEYSAEDLTYDYDLRGQLTEAGLDEYEYDDNGNRNGDFTPDTNNQLASDSTFTYTYDEEGNRITRTRISSDPADDYLTEYEWDNRNRLVKVTTTNNDLTPAVTKIVEYEYDAFNRRVSKEIDTNGDTTPDEIVQFVYDGLDIVLQLDGAGAITHRYLHGPMVDQILADEHVSDPEIAGDLYWALSDNLGTVRDWVEVTYDSLLDEFSVDLVNHVVYNSLGQVLGETLGAPEFVYAFTGRERDRETGLQYNWHRYYDAATVRWLSEDPIGLSDGPNLTIYVHNQSTLFTDPSGLAPPSIDSLPRTGYGRVEPRTPVGLPQRQQLPQPTSPPKPNSPTEPSIGAAKLPRASEIVGKVFDKQVKKNPDFINYKSWWTGTVKELIEMGYTPTEVNLAMKNLDGYEVARLDYSLCYYAELLYAYLENKRATVGEVNWKEFSDAAIEILDDITLGREQRERAEEAKRHITEDALRPNPIHTPKGGRPWPGSGGIRGGGQNPRGR